MYALSLLLTHSSSDTVRSHTGTAHLCFTFTLNIKSVS